MVLIPDDYIIRSMERTGYPYWITPDFGYEEEDDEADDPGGYEEIAGALLPSYQLGGLFSVKKCHI